MSRLLIFALAILAGNLVKGDIFDDFHDRVDRFVNETINSDRCNIWTEILRLEYGAEETFCRKAIMDAIDRVNSQRDGVDFNLAAFSVIMNKHWNSTMLDEELKSAMVEAFLRLPFWLSESGNLNNMQYWSENHQIGWKAGKYLIGQAFAKNPELKDLIFEASQTNGSVARDVGQRAVEEWMDYRVRFGWSEFNSDTYGPIAFKALESVAVCADDLGTQLKSWSRINLHIFDHIIGSRYDRIATARGRAYSEGKIDDKHYGFMQLFKGFNEERLPWGDTEIVMIILAMNYGFGMPAAFIELALEVEEGTFEMRERFGLDSKDGELEGIGHSDPEDCVFWFGNGAYFAKETAECLFVTGDAYDLWDRTEIWGQIKPYKFAWDIGGANLIRYLGQLGDPIGGGSVLGYANVYTYRSKDFMLSSAQDYHIGKMIGQAHDWQATLDVEKRGTVFSHQPTSQEPDNGHSSDYWVGGIHPKVGQHERTLISIHSPDVLATVVFSISMTHAHFFISQYDEFFATENGWYFGRQGESYVGLYSYNTAVFRPPNENEEDSERDLVADGIQNVWICEVGSSELDGSFQDFMTKIDAGKVEVEFTYDDSFIECFIDNECLNGGIVHFFECIAQICSPIKYQEKSEIASCLVKAEEEGGQSKIDCLSVRSSDVKVNYEQGGDDGKSFSFGWQEDLIVDGVVQQLSDFPRYANAFTEVPWGGRVFNISSENYWVYMDFGGKDMEEEPVLIEGMINN